MHMFVNICIKCVTPPYISFCGVTHVVIVACNSRSVYIHDYSLIAVMEETFSATDCKQLPWLQQWLPTLPLTISRLKQVHT